MHGLEGSTEEGKDTEETEEDFAREPCQYPHTCIHEHTHKYTCRSSRTKACVYIHMRSLQAVHVCRVGGGVAHAVEVVSVIRAGRARDHARAKERA